MEELRNIIETVGDETTLYLTGKDRCQELWPYVDEVTELSTPYTVRDEEEG